MRKTKDGVCEGATGTLYGYNLHVRWGSPSCDACLAARSDYMRRWRADQKRKSSARDRATKRLIEANRAEFAALLAEEMAT